MSSFWLRPDENQLTCQRPGPFAYSYEIAERRRRSSSVTRRAASAVVRHLRPEAPKLLSEKGQRGSSDDRDRLRDDLRRAGGTHQQDQHHVCEAERDERDREEPSALEDRVPAPRVERPVPVEPE